VRTRDYTYRGENGEVILLPHCVSRPEARRRAYGLAYRTTRSERAAVSAAESVEPVRGRRTRRSSRSPIPSGRGDVREGSGPATALGTPVPSRWELRWVLRIR
jgi:hypothetical protein